VKLKLHTNPTPRKTKSSVFFKVLAFSFAVFLIKMGIVSQDALNQLQALIDQGLLFIILFFFLSPFLFIYFFKKLSFFVTLY